MFVPYKTQLRRSWKTHFPARTQLAVSVTTEWNYRQHLFAWATLLLTTLVVLLPNLSYPLIEPDETRYAQIAIEMNTSHEWVTPTLDGLPYLDKPPLLYWLTAATFQILGVNETAARLPSMLAALATILLTFGWGARIVGQRPAWLAAITLTLSGGFILAGRFLILDSLLTLFTTASLLSGYIAVRGQCHRPTWWMVAGIACALGVLTKGPVAFVLCAPPLVVSGWLRADESRTRVWHWIAFVLPMVVFCVPWYAAVAKFNPHFVDYFFWEHNFQRFMRGSNHEQPLWFYIPIVFAAMFPSSLLLPSVGVFLASRADRIRSLRSEDVGFLCCAAIWALAFFSAASCKLPTYILPVIPLLCLIMGVMLDQTVFRLGATDRITNYLRPFPQRANLIMTACGLVSVSIDIWIGNRLSVASIAASTGCVLVLATTTWRWNGEAAFGRTAWATTAAISTCVLLFVSSALLPTISTERSAFVEIQRVADATPDAWIVFFGEKPHGSAFHLSNYRTTFFPKELEEEFVVFVERLEDLILVTDDERIVQTRQRLAGTHLLTESPNHEHVYRASRVQHPVAEVARVDTVNR
ncbi:4-amino-4-deoxy-L-arabinose transferase-like glycosyltransferase [Rhodopirellula rubra]|uniref:4-amino-4-deoxy-L-arabinose transferase-like glycosyltransferase n=1 Tax=Aporhodopirellula rubra TaxID=980271 RepID=A0A7W5E1N1_9BACT|nr:glycosyltransferase family 39 protein [Aporhodopirellula rubra]MBB3208485.1 4-amino-4-deoxy-L-arabinose transferase-like glycosyltransferase [Aporhodopirellula rubra]